MKELALTLTHNVNIKVIDRNKRVIRDINIHNKANSTMIEGVLRFLRGDFDITKYKEANPSLESIYYIPVDMRIGNIGVMIDSTDEDTPRFQEFDTGQIKTPSFDEYRLQKEIGYNNQEEYILDYPTNFDSSVITTSDDPNNSMSLLISKFYSAGSLVGYGRGAEREYYTNKNVGPGKGWVYYNPYSMIGPTGNPIGEYETMLSELGLYSSDNRLLARVAFDGEVHVSDTGIIRYADPDYEYNPIIQSDSSSVLVKWKIGITSIGANDHIISGADLRDLGYEN